MKRSRDVLTPGDPPLPLDAAWEAVEPLLHELEALDAIRGALIMAVRMKAELPRLQDEHATLSTDVARLRRMRQDLQGQIEEGLRAVQELGKQGVKTDLSDFVSKYGAKWSSTP